MKDQCYYVSETPQTDHFGLTIYSARTVDEKGNLRGQHGATPQTAVDRLKCNLAQGKEGVSITFRLLAAQRAHKPGEAVNDFKRLADTNVSSTKLLELAEGPIERQAVARALMSLACEM